MITELLRYTGNCTFDFSTIYLKITKFPVIKETTHGYWIEYHNGNQIKKWVTKEKCRKFAYETEGDALINFLVRRDKQIRILKKQLAQAKQERRLVSQMIREKGIKLTPRLEHKLR